MRCEDCLPLIEEYFDGEADARAAASVAAHLSKCADCAAALDALRFEHEAYARYDRGLEVTPALWAAVSSFGETTGCSSSIGDSTLCWFSRLASSFSVR